MFIPILTKYSNNGNCMFITDLFEDTTAKQLVVIYPGRFQPFHKGHKAVYEYLCKKYGAANVWICTSDKVEPPKSPFNFQEKSAMMQLTGVDISHVVQSTQPYQAREVLANYDPASTIVLFAVSEKDMAEDPRFKFSPKKDGSPSYFQPAPQSLKQAATFNQHGYIMTVPTFNFSVLGKPATSATQIRAQYANADEATKKAIVKDLFGAYSDEVYNIMTQELHEDAAGVGVVASNKKMAKDPRYSMSMTTDVHTDTPAKNAKAFKLI